MKLFFCPFCKDILALRKHYRSCECGRSGGKYIDNINAEISGEAIALGIHNMSLGTAIGLQPLKGWGKRIDAFVIPKICSTVSKNIRSTGGACSQIDSQNNDTVPFPDSSFAEGEE
jgi:hypothetical protein